MRVFDDIDRSDPRPCGDTEPLFSFLNRVAGEYWDQVRQVIDQWYSGIPLDSRVDLRARLRDDNDYRNVYGALWELYLHEMFLGAGYSVSCHPHLHSVPRRPDFLVAKDGFSFYAEAHRISDPNDTVAAENRRAAVYAAVNSLIVHDFFLEVEIESEGRDAPSLRRLKSGLESWLATLNADDIKFPPEEFGFEGLPEFYWEDREWSATFKAIPKSLERRGKRSLHAIGIYSPQVWRIDDQGRLRKALKGKRGAYGKFDRPYLVALATSGISHDEEDMEAVLYGATREDVTFEGTAVKGTQVTRVDDGFWSLVHSRNSGVSGVLSVHNPAPWSWATAVPTLWENPEPQYSPPVLPTWRRIRVSGPNLDVQSAGGPPHGVLGIPCPWPTGEPFVRQYDAT